jgi:hypothetical protein
MPYPSFSDLRHLGMTYSIDGISVPRDYFISTVEAHFHGSLGFALLEMSARASRGTFSHWSVRNRAGRDIGMTFEPGDGNTAATYAYEVHGSLVRNWLVTDSSWSGILNILGGTLPIIDPQNPERPLTQNEVGVIRQKLAGLLTDKCQKFINDLFKAAGSSYSTDILKGFNEINDASKTGKGGIFFKYDQIDTTKDGQPLYAGGTASGVASLGNGRVNLNPGAYSRLDLGTNALYAASTALHETIHAITGLGDGLLAKAVGRMRGVDYKNGTVHDDSLYWGQALKDACLPKGY